MTFRSKRILYDEDHKPVYVYLDYDEFLAFEALVEALDELPDEPPAVE